MNFIPTSLADAYILEPKVFSDPRGYFFESYNKKYFEDQNIHLDFIQDNQAKSTKGILRGFHFQKDPFAQTKLVRVLSGEIQDVIIDIRPNSATYGQSISVILSSENKRQLLVPRGFAHAYLVLSETAEVLYKVDNTYVPQFEGGLRWNDPKLAIKWELPDSEIQTNERDNSWSDFTN